MAAARGPYAKGKAKRAEILDVALEVIAREGYTGATVKELADAVGLSQNGLLHYFGSKDALFAEILRRRDEIAEIEIDFEEPDFIDGLVDRILSAVDEETSSPGMEQLSLRVTGEATEPDHLAHDYVRDRYTGMRAVIRSGLTRLQSEGRLAAEIDPDITAALVFASWDGLRIQWMYDKSIDIHSHMAYLLTALGIDLSDRSSAATGA
ncbi:TetR/AcrR family transcriptional regulator [Micromonospora sp. DT81.3]|uniref:TetR/AcrR family transcriptional regulator n=1 Tax=Micromonospora sp. DT81.3 TaxID=3416523 RepID=UPI003CEAAEC3